MFKIGIFFSFVVSLNFYIVIWLNYETYNLIDAKPKYKINNNITVYRKSGFGSIPSGMIGGKLAASIVFFTLV